MDQWFTQYEDALRQLKINDPKYLWNVDEHSAEDLVKTKKVFGIKGIKSFQAQSREKAQHTTIITYINVSGYVLPPMIIHREKYHDCRCTNVPRRVLVHSSKKGYINKQLFTEYSKMLLCHLHTQGQLDRPKLIVMDSHYSHTFNYCYMNMMYTHDCKVLLPVSPVVHNALHGVGECCETVREFSVRVLCSTGVLRISHTNVKVALESQSPFILVLVAVTVLCYKLHLNKLRYKVS